MKRGLLVVRNNGLQYLQKVIDRISVIESLTIKAILQVKWKEEEVDQNVRGMYGHIGDEIIIQKIVEMQGTSMIAIILSDSKPDPYRHSCGKCGKKTGEERLDNMNINRIKDDIRVQYGNIIHSADTEEKALEEIIRLGGGHSMMLAEMKPEFGVFLNSAFSCDQILRQLNTMEDGTKVWEPLNK